MSHKQHQHQPSNGLTTGQQSSSPSQRLVCLTQGSASVTLTGDGTPSGLPLSCMGLPLSSLSRTGRLGDGHALRRLKRSSLPPYPPPLVLGGGGRLALVREPFYPRSRVFLWPLHLASAGPMPGRACCELFLLTALVWLAGVLRWDAPFPPDQRTPFAAAPTMLHTIDDRSSHSDNACRYPLAQVLLAVPEKPLVTY